VLRSADHLILAHGACIVLELADDAVALARLPLAEQQRAVELAPFRRREYIAGRTALHLALDAAATGIASDELTEHADSAAILSDERGAPILPPGWVGSVSHKGAFAAALVTAAGDGHIGIDLERAQPSRHDIARRILTAREQAALPDRELAVTLRFAIKEAIYKALDPYVRRYVGFTEVELDFAGDAVTVTTELPFAIEVTWREHAGHWLTTASARRSS